MLKKCLLSLLLVLLVNGQADYTIWLAKYHASQNPQCNDTLNDFVTALEEQGCLDLTPMPSTTYDIRAPPLTYSSPQIKPHLYWISETAYNCLLYAPPNGPTILIDAPPTHGENLRNRVWQILNGRKLDYFIYSHHHADHVGGSSLIVQFWPNVKIVAHVDAIERILQSNPSLDTPIPLPTITFKHTATIGPFQLKDSNDVHSAGNIYIYSPSLKVLMIVDVIYPGWIPYYNWGVVENFARYLQAHDEILAYDFDVIVGGHVTRPGNRNDVLLQRQFFIDLRQAIQDAQQQVTFPGVAAELGDAVMNPWITFDTFLQRLLSICYNTMVDKYRHRLAGAEVMMHSHCFSMFEFVSIG